MGIPRHQRFIQVMLATTAIAVASVLAFYGLYLSGELNTWTPGLLVSFLLKPESMFRGFIIQVAVDFVFWFVVMYAIYWLIRHRKDAGN